MRKRFTKKITNKKRACEKMLICISYFGNVNKMQKVISQRKEQDKTPEEQVNEVEMGKSRKHREPQAG